MTYSRRCRDVAAALMLASSVACSSPPPAAESAIEQLPRVPCAVTGDERWRDAADKWCDGQLFRNVNVGQGDSSLVITLIFTPGGERAFERNRYRTLNQFRRLADEMATTMDMNVAFALFGDDEKMIAGCARKRAEDESLCN